MDWKVIETMVLGLTLTIGIGGEPGKYRVVTDYKNNFAGVMIENAGASFSRCTVNDD